MDYYDEVEEFDGEFSPEMYYDDPEYGDVAEMLQSGWFSPENGGVERLGLTEVFENCVRPTMTQAFMMILPLVLLSLMFKIMCSLLTEDDRPAIVRKIRKEVVNNTVLNGNDSKQNGKSENGHHHRNGSPKQRKNVSAKQKTQAENGKSKESSEGSDAASQPANADSGDGYKRDYTNIDLLAVSAVHVTSALFGGMALHLFFQWNAIYLAIMALLLYAALLISHRATKEHCGPIVSVCVAVFIIVCELLVVDAAPWHKIRGAAMIIAMKVISIGFDLDVGVIPFPEIHEYIGYTFNIGTVIFGPWVSFQDYMCVELQHKYRMGLRWVMRVVTSFFCSAVCLVISTCFVHWLILDGSFKWMVAYRDAQSFRFSHYFISYLSELTAICAGIGAIGFNGDASWDLTVTRSYNIEFPRSLVEVVTNWNLPMHYWLKTYVFRAARPLGTFTAILLTYAASSLLHGLNFQLAAVLFSLGFYSYVEYVLRKRLAKIFNACIEAKKCKEECSHEYQWRHPVVFSANFCFGLLAMFHLAYLGLMFDGSSAAETGYTMEHTLNKWAKLDYLSHFVAIGSFIFYFLIR